MSLEFERITRDSENALQEKRTAGPPYESPTIRPEPTVAAKQRFGTARAPIVVQQDCSRPLPDAPGSPQALQAVQALVQQALP